MIVLPNELLDQTLDELCDDTETLRSCLGTCSRLRKLTQRVFYADVTINLNGPSGVIRRRLDRLQGVLPLALRHMRILQIVFGPMEVTMRLFATLILRAISAGAALNELHLKGRYEMIHTEILSRLMTLPSIRALSFFACPNISVTMLQNRPALRSLNLRRCSVLAPFNFTHFYSTDALYEFATNSPFDENGIKLPKLLELSLGLPEHRLGDRVLLQRAGAHLTTLTLYMHSTDAEDYGALIDVNLDSFPVLSSLSILFEISLQINIPIDLVSFLRGRTANNVLRHLHIGFDHVSPFFEDLVAILPYIMSSNKPFALEQVFDQKNFPSLLTGCCVLQLSVYALDDCDPEALQTFKERATREFKTFFPRQAGGMDCVNVGAQVGEVDEDVDVFC